MAWLCGCDKEATRMEVLWEWRRGGDIGHKHGRDVAYGCRIGCVDCVPKREDERGRLQYFALKLNAATKEALVDQVLAQVLRMDPRGYLPKTDIRRALRDLHKRRD